MNRFVLLMCVLLETLAVAPAHAVTMSQAASSPQAAPPQTTSPQAAPPQAASPPAPAIQVVLPPGVDAARVAAVKRVAIFLTGEDPLRVRLAQDALSLELFRLGVAVVEQTKAEQLVATELAKRVSTDQAADDKATARAGVKASAKPAATPPVSDVMPDVTELARSLGADGAFTGTLVERVVRVEDTTRRAPIETKETSEKVLVVAASLQLMDAKSGQLMFSAVVTFDNGVSLAQAAAALAQGFANARAGR